MASFTLKFDTAQAQKSIRRFRELAPSAVARALNKSAESAKVNIARNIAKDMKMKVGAAKDRVQVREATPNRLSAAVSASLKRIPLIELDAKGPEPSRGRGRGVTAKTATRRYPHAFITRVGGHRGVFTRRTRARLPIQELKGPSVGFVFDKHVGEAQKRGEQQLLKNLRSELRFALGKSAS